MKQSIIIAELKEIARRHGGALRPAEVVAFAANPKTALHGRFEWDNTEAAEKWRLHQARNIIRVCIETNPALKKKFRIFVSLVPDRQDGEGYKSLDLVMKSANSREQLLADALAELETFRQKYATLKELAGIFREIKRIKVKGGGARRGEAEHRVPV